ncbi:MAG: hypothetical protein AAGI49_17595, partial [Bacteroidota bacterium]
MNLAASFFELVQRYTTSAELQDQLWQNLAQHYQQKNRAYHNLTHIQSMLEQVGNWEEQIEDVEVLQFAIWYHDLIYNPLRKDNEARSAKAAQSVLRQLHLAPERIQQCAHLILCTKTHQLSADADFTTQLMVDVDLAILSRPWAAYETYYQQIRREYWMYPSPMYRKGRKKALQT